MTVVTRCFLNPFLNSFLAVLFPTIILFPIRYSFSIISSDRTDMTNRDDDRSSANYHKKWDKVTKEELAKLEEELEIERKLASTSLGINCRNHDGSSEAKEYVERKELEQKEEKKKMLQEAKMRWSESEDKEMSRRLIVGGGGGDDDDDEQVIRTISEFELEMNTKSLHIRECTKQRFEIKTCARPIKLFIERAKDTTVSFAGVVKTSTMEIWDCKNCEITFESEIAATKTTQIDGCENVTLLFPNRENIGSIYHSETRGLSIVFTDESMLDGKNIHTVEIDHQRHENTIDENNNNNNSDNKNDDDDDESKGKNKRNVRVTQHLTRYVDGKILTERVIRGKDEFPMTARELNASSVEEAEAKAKEERSSANKAKGNEAFKSGDYGQAIAHYELSLQDTDVDADKSILHSNRSACFLKLGRLEEALKDAEQSVLLDGKNVKGNFRVGLALHALKRYGEAVIALEKAQSLEKKTNKDIDNAIRMAEFMGRKQPPQQT